MEKLANRQKDTDLFKYVFISSVVLFVLFYIDVHWDSFQSSLFSLSHLTTSVSFSLPCCFQFTAVFVVRPFFVLLLNPEYWIRCENRRNHMFSSALLDHFNSWFAGFLEIGRMYYSVLINTKKRDKYNAWNSHMNEHGILDRITFYLLEKAFHILKCALLFLC